MVGVRVPVGVAFDSEGALHVLEYGGRVLRAAPVGEEPDAGRVHQVDNPVEAVACLAEGALDYLAKPFLPDEVRARVRLAMEKRRLILENRDYLDRLATQGRELAP